MSRPEGTAIVGVDGGGTTTEAVAVTADGRVLGRGEGGPSNYQVVGEEAAVAELVCAVRRALGDDGPGSRRVEGIFAGVAGVNHPRDAVRIERGLARAFPEAAIWVENDAVAALGGAVGTGAGIVIIAGTGSIATGRNAAGERCRAGGWGPLLGDEGSAYDISRRALVAVARAADGRGPETSLGGIMLCHLRLASPEDLYERMYIDAMPRHEIAALYPLVAQAASEGDAVAAALLDRAVEELAAAVIAVARRLDLLRETFPLAPAGGVFRRSEGMAGRVARAVARRAPGARLIRPRARPVFGAAALALKALGRDPERLLQRVESSTDRA